MYHSEKLSTFGQVSTLTLFKQVDTDLQKNEYNLQHNDCDPQRVEAVILICIMDLEYFCKNSEIVKIKVASICY